MKKQRAKVLWSHPRFGSVATPYEPSWSVRLLHHGNRCNGCTLALGARSTGFDSQVPDVATIDVRVGFKRMRGEWVTPIRSEPRNSEIVRRLPSTYRPLLYACLAQWPEHFHGKEGVMGSTPIVGLPTLVFTRARATVESGACALLVQW